jgi:nucleoside-diphosphate-sugar epimerase
MKYCVSGVNGFIGSHLRERLEKIGDEVVGIDRELLLKPSELQEFIVSHTPDYIIHLAAYGNHSYQKDEQHTFLTNVLGTYNMLQSTKDYPYKGFFNFSTTSHNLEASTFYGSTKSSGEYLMRSFVNVFNKPIVNIRPYSVFGEREWDFRFIPTICEQIRHDREITVSDVSHDWIYIEDFLDGLINTIQNVDLYSGKSVGIGSGNRVSNLTIAKLLMNIAGKQVTVNQGTIREYEIANHEYMISGEKRNDEIYCFDFAKTPLKEALNNVYNNPNFLVRTWVN